MGITHTGIPWEWEYIKKNWEWDGREWELNRWEWEGMGMLKAIPTHLYIKPRMNMMDRRTGR